MRRDKRRDKQGSTDSIRSPLHQSAAREVFVDFVSTYWREMAPAIPCRKTGTRRSWRQSLQNKTDRYSSCDLFLMTLDRQHQVCENASRTRITFRQDAKCHQYRRYRTPNTTRCLLRMTRRRGSLPSPGVQLTGGNRQIRTTPPGVGWWSVSVIAWSWGHPQTALKPPSPTPPHAYVTVAENSP